MLDWRSEVLVRPAKTGDATGLARLFAVTWRAAYGGIIPYLSLENIIRRRGKNWWTNAIRSGDGLLIIEHEGKLAGYATFGAARGRGPHQGEIYELYITPIFQGFGLGEHLFEACRARLDACGLKGLVVWALADNAQAEDFYWRRGGRPFAAVHEKIGSADLEKIGYGWT